MECLCRHIFRHCFDFEPVFHVSSNSPANSRVSSSNVSRQSTQEYVDSSFEMYEPEQQTFQLTSPARKRWIEAFNKVCAELSEVSDQKTFVKKLMD